MIESDYTVSEVAKIIKKRPESVVAMIISGALQAYDASSPGDKRRSYRVTPQAFEDFKAGRSPQQAKPATRRARHVKPANFVEYFK